MTTSIGRVMAARPMITDISSMRLLVVSASPPESSRSWPFQIRIAPQPPGPGLPEQAPSVHSSTTSATSLV
jgi:hypothetical protein